MNVNSALASLADGTIPATLKGLKSHADVEWLRGALARGGAGKLRKRKLSAEDIAGLVIGMALYRDQPMVDVAHRLDLVLPEDNGAPGKVTKGAIPQARERIGAAPLRALFETTAQHWALESARRYLWRGLMVLGGDGSAWRVPDSPENRSEFQLPPASRSIAGYPQVRVAVLMALRSHLWLDFEFADCRTGESSVAWPLIQRVPDQSVTILDRYCIDYAQLHELRSTGKNRHWLLRARKGLKWKVIRRFSPGDELVL